MLHTWISFLRHSLRHFPEGNLIKHILGKQIDGVPGSSLISRVTIEVTGSSPVRNSFLQIDRPKVRERELAKIDAKRRAKKLKCGNAQMKARTGKEKGGDLRSRLVLHFAEGRTVKVDLESNSPRNEVLFTAGTSIMGVR